MTGNINFFKEGTFRNVSIPNAVYMDPWFSGRRLKVYTILYNLCFIKKNKNDNQTTVSAAYICKCLGLKPNDSNKKNINTIIRDLCEKGYISTEIVQGGIQRHRITHINQVEEIYFDDINYDDYNEPDNDINESNNIPMPWELN